jgi:hypothetical protein
LDWCALAGLLLGFMIRQMFIWSKPCTYKLVTVHFIRFDVLLYPNKLNFITLSPNYCML